jgi:Xaa-Pro aminopeptidase
VTALDDAFRASLRTGRLERLQAAMRARRVESCLLFNEPNVRYATGVSAMPIWSNTTFINGAVVPAEGRPVVFMHGNSVHLFEGIEADVRPMYPWEFIDDAETQAAVFAREVVEVRREMGVDAASPLAVDRLGTPGFLALQRKGIRIVDSAAVTADAREVKTAEEISLLELNAYIVMRMLEAFESALTPGVRECDLLAVLVDTLLRGGGEHVATNTVCSGPNTNPWRAEATGRKIEPGDLVYVDTDTVGIEGYFFCVSRTFLCGDARPTASQLDAYRAAHEWLLGMREVVRPGLTCAEIAERAPRIPERYLPQRYECMIHGVGLEEESPSVVNPIDPQPNRDRVIREDMALVIELYCGEVGGRDGVKLGDQVLVKGDGPKVLVPYPYEDAIL